MVDWRSPRRGCVGVGGFSGAARPRGTARARAESCLAGNRAARTHLRTVACGRNRRVVMTGKSVGADGMYRRCRQFVSALASGGVGVVAVGSGSRSTPLVLAFHDD